MLNKLRTQLWEAMYLNPVWPHELLENAKDPEYKNISFKPLDAGLEVELLFMDEGQLVKAVYLFDSNDYLQRAVMYENEHESVIYDRNQLVTNIMNEILELTGVKQSNKIIA
ncbi:hypothetical protein [Parageobacillus thermoglucosidasius]|uniref:hypothetical protein n=1 Tax=Parageobacillus thermoglucosidasius TaxID=1426 RepID=UPI000557E5DA|nr:hypothetical protein [Parageobacillus thermoglucosidasius]MED4904078.1 hypothetical protein [Parageobacillus thermoglucosidasius]MED4915628.1 hypothetical protein [Parageobacillus thermoglucosidasius]MED4945107.1 hypothetical protein [Parageobacillus thermoglucosidasius]MED4983696.1 hypothetical protein [Parageobacillus thermoglucosidasius]RDE19358.1 hypothetical protein DV714_20220 [Parageobacillus thermoglucosidasius]